LKGYNEALKHVDADICTNLLKYQELVATYSNNFENEPNTGYYSTQNTRFKNKEYFECWSS
jgi:hypothetical protein